MKILHAVQKREQNPAKLNSRKTHAFYSETIHRFKPVFYVAYVLDIEWAG